MREDVKGEKSKHVFGNGFECRDEVRSLKYC